VKVKPYGAEKLRNMACFDLSKRGWVNPHLYLFIAGTCKTIPTTGWKRAAAVG